MVQIHSSLASHIHFQLTPAHLPGLSLNFISALRLSITQPHCIKFLMICCLSILDVFSSKHISRLSYKCLSACVLSRFGRVRLFVTPWTVAHQAPLSMGFSRQEYWGGLLCPPPGGLPNPGIKPTSLLSPALAITLPWWDDGSLILGTVSFSKVDS